MGLADFYSLIEDIDRERLDPLMEEGGPAAVVNALGPLDPADATLTPPPFSFVKDMSAFYIFREFPVAEPPLEAFDNFYTPNELFFVCNEMTTPRVAIKPYRIRVGGDAVTRPIELSYNDLVSLPSKVLPAYLECAGNQRAMFERTMGRRAEDVQWGLGGVGMARWTGVELWRVLELAGLKPSAAYVNIKGLDISSPEKGVSRPMPLDKALEPDTLLAYGMNGKLLPPDHGFPVRAVVPGWIGANSVKWVGTVTVSSYKIWVDRNTQTYTYQGEPWPEANYAPAKGAPIDSQNIRSSLVLPWPAKLKPGKNRLRGFARSPFANVAEVLWSADDGVSWQEAELLEPVQKWAWTFFEFTWDATPGKHSLRTRATDAAGNTQPMEVSFNTKGYMYNAVYPHPVRVG